MSLTTTNVQFFLKILKGEGGEGMTAILFLWKTKHENESEIKKVLKLQREKLRLAWVLLTVYMVHLQFLTVRCQQIYVVL